MAKISVLMGIYNCAQTLDEAIGSILAQTYTNWEMIMCDDGSTDNTYKIASKYCEEYPDKFILLKNEVNQGLNATLNRCLLRATGEYIARMDGDDLCSPDRFAEEVAILDAEPDIAIVSTSMECFDENGVWGCVQHKEYPVSRDFLYRSPFCHAPCMVRREAYDAVEGYSNEPCFLRVEDYHLWVKMYHAGYRGKNLMKPLYQMRDDRGAYQRRKFKYRLNEAYVKILAVKLLDLPVYGYIYALRPILVGLLPTAVYDLLHKRRLRGTE